MLRAASGLGIALVLAGCTGHVVFDDLLDASATDASPGKDATIIQGPDGCGTRFNSLYFRPRGAQLMIMLDRSRSMQSSFGDSTRQTEAQTALSASLNRYQWKVKFGFEQFPANSNDDSYEDCQRGYCCAGKPDVKPNYGEAGRINGFMKCVDPVTSPCPSPSEASPSNAALDQVRKYYNQGESRSYSANDDRYVLLVTSSEPTCTTFSGSDPCADALEAAGYLGGMGIRVVVLSVGYTPGTGSCLVQLSLTGSSLRPPEGMETLYWPDTSSSLSAAVDSIVRGVATTSCTLDTNDVPAPAQIQLGVSLGDDNWIAPDPENGWSFANLEHTSIKLSGQACDQFVRSSKSIYAGYFCSTCGGYNACP